MSSPGIWGNIYINYLVHGLTNFGEGKLNLGGENPSALPPLYTSLWGFRVHVYTYICVIYMYIYTLYKTGNEGNHYTLSLFMSTIFRNFCDWREKEKIKYILKLFDLAMLISY